jgi:diguanylate cyclase (GGDEF)-like protein
MPSPGSPVELRSSIAAGFLDIIAETIQPLDHSARGQFLRGFFRTLTHLEISEEKSARLWEEILLRRQSLAGSSGQPVSLQTALVDVFASSDLFRFPLLIERDDLKKLELNAVTDPLTGLHNRRLFRETFEKELNRAKRYAHPLSLVMLDLHRFKEVNDRHGHPRGDDVLRAVAATLRKSLRTSDSAFRIGGDEFSLILPQTDSAQAVSLSKRVGVVFSEVLHSLQISVNVSMDHGVATFAIDGEQADQLIHIADERLYRLKHANRGNPVAEPPPALSVEPSPASPEELPSVPPQAAPDTLSAVRETSATVETLQPERPAPLEMPRPRQASDSSLAAAVSASTTTVEAVTPIAGPGIQARPNYAVQRKAERVSMTGTNAYAVLGESASRRAKVLDLGFGGVALELESSQELPDNFLAVLHVPILPPVRVSLKPVWSRSTSEGSLRVGCCFVS